MVEEELKRILNVQFNGILMVRKNINKGPSALLTFFFA